jgi:hypothetical protein
VGGGSARPRTLDQFRGLTRSPEPLLGLGSIAPALGNLAERAPHPRDQLPFAEFLRHAERSTQVILGLIEPPELADDVPAFGRGVRELPPRAQLLEDGEAALDARKRLLEAAEVLEGSALAARW